MPITTIKQGESFDFEFDRNGESIAGWVCTINLKKFPDDTAIINRVITPTGDVWSGTLTNDDTKDLDVSQYLLIGKLTNESTGENEQDIIRFYVSKGW